MLNNRFIMQSLKLTALENSRCVLRKEINLLFKRRTKIKSIIIKIFIILCRNVVLKWGILPQNNYKIKK